MHLFNDPNVVIYSANAKEFQSLLQSVKQYLLLCLSRNAVSSVLSVFELSCEIFWRCIHGLRTKLKVRPAISLVFCSKLTSIMIDRKK